jgi:hypothetical protein
MTTPPKPPYREEPFDVSAQNTTRIQMIDEYLKRGGGPKVQTIVARGGVN